jgi:hypothetical protein
MDMEQLAQELAMLKAENAAAKEQKRLGGFIDKYGTKFNGNTDIANLILAEMDRRGVDEASEAASEAIQSVLDKLREEATMVLDQIKDSQQQVSDLVSKIDDIQSSVDAATSGGSAPEAGGTPPPSEGAMPPEEGGLPPEMAAPPEGDMGGMPPPEGGMGGEVPPGEDMGGGGGGGAAPPPGELPPDTGGGDMGGAPPPPPGGDMGGAPPPDAGGLPPEQVPSDVRIKNIKQKFAAYKQSRQNVPSDQNLKKVWKPKKDTLAVIRGLM